MTQLELAKKGIISPQMKAAAAYEKVAASVILEGIASGEIVIPANINHKNFKPYAIGKGITTKVNANIGTSTDYGDVETELKKLEAAVSAGADAVMDLSTGGDIRAVRKAIIDGSELPHDCKNDRGRAFFCN